MPANQLSAKNVSKPAMDKWSVSSRIFHWVSVVLLIITWVMITKGEVQLHKAFGLSVLCWTIARLINRLFTKSPPDIPMPKPQAIIAHLTHFMLYGLLLAMPMAGFMLSMYGNHGVNVFGLFTIPVLVTPNEDKAELLENIHTKIIWMILLVLSGLHIAGALYHQFVKKDNLIARMK